ncbi:uncharacterized protein LOC127797978 isoform X3 [Diospyros lotus]|uniref:uncharacterized protein LOC127797978 isoform X3 n=1 Tax=Diospyros lotus TaxID=55363 RepID=UPI0022597C22|nr:uncharacterized protein LOC127797978 isoform X3 [Diospyros lotus]
MLDLLVVVIAGAFTLCAAVIQGTLASRRKKKSDGNLGSHDNKKSNGTEANGKHTGNAEKKLASLKETAKNLRQEGERIRTEQHEVVNSYRSQVTALMLLSLFYGVASIYLQLSYTDEVKMTILSFLNFGVAFRMSLTKLQKISKSTGGLRRRLKELQRQVKDFKELFTELSRQMRRQIAGLEKDIAEAMELSKSKDNQADESSVLLPLAACAVACARCIPGLSLSQLVQLLVLLCSLASTHPTLLLSTILQGCLLMLNHSGKDWD